MKDCQLNLPRQLPLRPPLGWMSPLAVAIGTSLMFFVGYGGAAYFTELNSHRAGTWYYQWEHVIPFVPMMIIPYMSIDLFFFASPFFCRNRRELIVLGWRLAAVVVIATACFLAFPLKLAVERPHADGWVGAIYNWFTSMDRPYNLCPSMHIALRTVLAGHYRKFCRGWLLWSMHFWFFLIGLSTLLLYQHHVIDVVGGFVLAVLVMFAFDGLPWRLPKTGGGNFAVMYAAIAAFLIAPVFAVPELGWFLIWPSVASGIVAWGYFWAGPAVYRRRDGKLTWPARFVLGPVLTAQWLSWKYYARQSAAIDRVADGVSIGRHLTDAEAQRLADGNTVAVVDVCNAFSEPDSLLKLETLRLPILDLTAPTDAQYDAACEFIEEHRMEGGVFVHCKAGYSRSAALVAAWLLSTKRAASVDDALGQLKSARPHVVVRPEIPISLHRWLNNS